MNPLFMQMMMNSMGMGCSPFMGAMNFMMPSLFCSSGMMSMPYYQNDNLGFLNFPIYRNTSYDYLLDPNYALQQCQANWRNGGGFGSTTLPGFTFPGFSPITAIPGMSGVTQQPQKTEAEKEAEKKKAEEAKKPAAKKAQKLNETFAKIKKLAEDKNNHIEISEELAQKAEEAMKKGTAEEQYKAIKEVVAAIPEDTLRKASLSDDNVRNQLRKAGYNFNLAGNKYCFKNSEINKNDIDHSDRMRQLHSDIVQKKYNELQVIAGQLSDPNNAKARILGVVSSWNDKFKGKESGILRLIGANLPTGNDAVAKTAAVQECTKVITQALLHKADEFEGCNKITKAREDVSKNLDAILQPNGFNQTNINKLAESFDKLYARLRMQEAININSYLKRNFSYLNEVKNGVITDQMVIEETQKDLEAEGLAYPNIDQLDPIPVTEEIVIQREQEMKDLDKEYEGDGKGKLESLTGEGKPLTKVEGKENVYQTKALGTSSKVRYFGVVDNKIYEVFKNGDNFETIEDATEVTAEDIGTYDSTVSRVNNLIANKTITEWSSEFPVFKATGANEYYTVKDNKLYHILNVKSIHTEQKENVKKAYVEFNDKDRQPISLDDITSEDIEEINDEDIKSTETLVKEQIQEQNQEVDAIEALTFDSLKDAESYKRRLEVSNLITRPENENEEKVVFEKVKDANGFFKSNYNGKVRYYKYDEKTNKLVCLTKYINNKECGGVISIKNGIASIKTSKGIETAEIRENILQEPLNENEKMEDKIKEYGLAFAKSVSGPDAGNDYPNAMRKLNTLVSTVNSKSLSTDEKAEFVVNFIKGYQMNCGWFTAQSKGICKQIFEESGFANGENINEHNSKARYISMIAKGILEYAKVTDYDNEKDIELLEKVSKGIFNYTYYTNSSNSLGAGLAQKYTYETLSPALVNKIDNIIDKIIKNGEK